MRAHVHTWSQFFARIGWPVTYRRGSLVVHGENPLLVVPTRALIDRQFAAATVEAEAAAIRLSWHSDVLIVGGHPLPAIRSWLRSDPPAGLLGEFDNESQEYDFDAGLWLRCGVCQRLGVYHEMRSWAARPCGHNDGPWHVRDANVNEISHAWAAACFNTQQRRATS